MMANDLGSRVDAIADRVRARHAVEREERKVAAVAHAATVEQRRAELRESMPTVAGLVDAFRAAGMDVSVLAAQEGGKTIINHKGCERIGVDLSGYEKG